jgi:hypothetical protein
MTMMILSSMDAGVGIAGGRCKDDVEEDAAMDANFEIHEQRITIGSWD